MPKHPCVYWRDLDEKALVINGLTALGCARTFWAITDDYTPGGLGHTSDCRLIYTTSTGLWFDVDVSLHTDCTLMNSGRHLLEYARRHKDVLWGARPVAYGSVRGFTASQMYVDEERDSMPPPTITGTWSTSPPHEWVIPPLSSVCMTTIQSRTSDAPSIQTLTFDTETCSLRAHHAPSP